MSITDAVNTAVTNYSEESKFSTKSRSRGFTFTDYDVTNEGINYLIDIGRTVSQTESESTTPLVHASIGSVIEYMIYAIEICPTTNRQHFQGFIYFKNPQHLHTTIKKLAPRHVEAMAKRSTPRYNREYILKGNYVDKTEYKLHNTSAPDYGKGVNVYKYGAKDNLDYSICNVHEYGECPTQGERKDLKQVFKMIKSREITTPLQLADNSEHLWCQYNKSLISAMELYKPDRNTMPKVQVFWGEAGAGKSRYARDNGYTFITFSGDKKAPFVSNYVSETKVIIDDFEHGQVSIGWFLKFTDRYPFNFNTKGGSQKCLVTDIILTSNENPEQWWPECDSLESRKAIMRRITKIYHITHSKDAPVISLPVTADLHYDDLYTDKPIPVESNLRQMTIADMQRILDENALLKKQNQEYVHILSQRT